jgi:hypothetical protein
MEENAVIDKASHSFSGHGKKRMLHRVNYNLQTLLAAAEMKQSYIFYE